MKSKKLVIFGNAEIAQIAKYYFDIDSDYETVAFTADAEYCIEKEFEGKPVIAFEEIEKTFPPAEYEMFVALSYSGMNRFREKKYIEAKAKGYTIASYISSKCSYLSQYPPGENAFIFEDNTIQPFVKIGNNVILWSGNHIGHHSVIHDHNFISSHVVISGHCEIESNCFLGVNATLAHKIKIASGTLLGAGVVISKNTEANRVYVSARPTVLDMTSDKVKL